MALTGWEKYKTTGDLPTYHRIALEWNFGTTCARYDTLSDLMTVVLQHGMPFSDGGQE